MNIQKLEAFLSLCDTLNYTETAELLYTTQGSVSKQIIALEKELGVTLFNRKHRQISLTREGREVQLYAKQIISSYLGMQQSLKKLATQKGQEVIIHGIPTMSAYPIISEIALFQKRHPNVQFEVEEEEADQLLHSLDEGVCDAIFIRSFGDKRESIYESVTLERDRFVVLLPQSHRLAQASKIDLNDLKNETFFQLGNKTHLLHQFLELCKDNNFIPKVNYQGNRINLIIDFVEQEMGVSIMMEKPISSFKDKAIVSVPLNTEVFSEMKLLRLKNNQSPALLLFWKMIKEKYSNKE